MNTDLPLDELRAVAEAATQGPWFRDLLHEVRADSGFYYPTVVEYCQEPPDAAHIAAFDPPTAIALLDEIAELRAKLAAVEALKPYSVPRELVGWLIQPELRRERLTSLVVRVDQLSAALGHDA